MKNYDSKNYKYEEFIKMTKIGMGIVGGTVIVTTAAAVGLGVYLIKKLCD